jgi:hypothetical protein
VQVPLARSQVSVVVQSSSFWHPPPVQVLVARSQVSIPVQSASI